MSHRRKNAHRTCGRTRSVDKRTFRPVFPPNVVSFLFGLFLSTSTLGLTGGAREVQAKASSGPSPAYGAASRPSVSAEPTTAGAPTPDTQTAGTPRPDTVVVGSRVVPPFVILEDDGTYSGLTVHLWDRIAGELGFPYRFRELDIPGLLEGVEDGTLFASAAALTITAEREARVDFTHPFMVTGLGIAVAREPAGLGGAVLSLFSPELLWVVLLLLGLLAFWGALVWVFERKKNAEEFGGTPAQGIGSGFWWAAVTMTTVGYGDKAPRTLGGRAVGFVWMFTAIIVISFFTATIASNLTLTRLDSRVGGPQDLPHVRVGGLEGSAAVAYLEEQGIRSTLFPSIQVGLEALAGGSIDAFVHDAPILRYYQQEDFPNDVRVLPGAFLEQYYGIALPHESPYRNVINQVLLEHLAGDEWDRQKRRYLGEE
jgi:polar amino acid transport system substrate-binding protein